MSKTLHVPFMFPHLFPWQMDICHPNPPGFCSDQPGGIYNPPPRTETPGSEVQLAGGDLVLVTEGVQLGQFQSFVARRLNRLNPNIFGDIIWGIS